MIFGRAGWRVLLLTLTAIAAVETRAQVLYGSIAGTVRDSSAAPVPGAGVRVTNTSTNQSRDSLTNESGDFSFPSLEAGAYDVTVSKESFQKFTSKDLRVDLDQTARLNVVLTVGALNQSVVVTADIATVQTDSAEVRGEVSRVELTNVPIPVNRNFESLLIERSEEHTSELQSHSFISYAVFCLKKK